MKIKYIVLVAFLCSLIPTSVHALQIDGVTIGPKVENPNLDLSGSLEGRDGGASGMVGDKILWTFGDTIFSPSSVDGKNLRSNTGGFGEPSNPTIVSEALDANGAPGQFIPLSTSDQTYNDTANSGTDRYAIWPIGVIQETQTSSLIYYLRLKVNGPGFDWTLLNTGFARISVGESAATRISGGGFIAPEPLFDADVMQHNGYNYFYGCKNAFGECSVARVPIASTLDKNAYQYNDGQSWQSDINQRNETLPLLTTVRWNSYIKKYVGGSHPVFSNDIQIMTSDHPEGPWSVPQTIYTSDESIYEILYHSEQDSQNGKVMQFGFYQPQKSNAKFGINTLQVTINGSEYQSDASGGTNQSNDKTSLVPGVPNAGNRRTSQYTLVLVAVLGSPLLFVLLRRTKKLFSR